MLRRKERAERQHTTLLVALFGFDGRKEADSANLLTKSDQVLITE
jgi:hypothetical protein